MGHETFYIAAVVAKTPTHVAFKMGNNNIEILSGPASYEQIALEMRERYPDAEFSRELPEDLETIQHNGLSLELEEMKSWHYIPFDRMVSRQLILAQ